MAMASWNGMTWECNSNVISYLESLSTSFSMDTQNNADKEGKSPTETVGLSPVEISFSTTYRIETGTHNIQATINLWKTMIGKAAPLIIWNDVFGPDLVQLQSVSVSNVSLRPDGMMRAATVSFKFKEYVETKKSVEKKETSSNSATTETALNVGPTKEEKTRKKSYYDIKAEQTRDR